MYKISLVILLIAAVCTAVPDVDQHEGEAAQYEAAPRADRMARATCDLLSASAGGVSVNHAACAAHCLYIGNGYRGGRCINGVCNCRK